MIKRLFKKKKKHIPMNEHSNIPAATNCEPKLAMDVEYSNGRFRRYVDFTCPTCGKQQCNPVWSDMEHIDPDTYNCIECGELLKIWVKEHITRLNGHKVYLGCNQ